MLDSGHLASPKAELSKELSRGEPDASLMLSTKHPPEFRFGVVILAAGSSTRMGQPKPLLRWGSSTAIGRLIEIWRTLEARQIAVVCAPDDGLLALELDRLGVPDTDRIFNPTPERGMFSSVQCAAQWAGWKRELTHWAVALVDQPHLRPLTLSAVLAAGAAAPDRICQPSFADRPKHPILLPKTMFGELATATEENLKDFLQNRAAMINYVRVIDSGLAVDLDRPLDYERAKESYRASSS